jgi:hypothetical protein
MADLDLEGGGIELEDAEVVGDGEICCAAVRPEHKAKRRSHTHHTPNRPRRTLELDSRPRVDMMKAAESEMLKCVSAKCCGPLGCLDAAFPRIAV